MLPDRKHQVVSFQRIRFHNKLSVVGINFNKRFFFEFVTLFVIRKYPVRHFTLEVYEILSRITPPDGNFNQARVVGSSDSSSVNLKSAIIHASES